MNISIVVPTMGDPTLLEPLWQSIKKYGEKVHEVIVIRQGGNKSWIPLTDAISPKIFVFDEFFIGLSKAKNEGLRKAQSDYVLFLDDDAELFPDTIKNFTQLLQQNPECIAFFGKTVDRFDNDSVGIFARSEGFLDKFNYRNRFIECPSVWHRNKFLALGGFDEKMGIGTLHGAEEGHDAVLRCLNHGLPMYFSPHVKVYHPHKTLDYAAMSSIRRSFYYRCGTAYLWKKHRRKRKLLVRLISLIFFIPFLSILKPKKVRFYFAEFLGTMTGLTLD